MKVNGTVEIEIDESEEGYIAYEYFQNRFGIKTPKDCDGFYIANDIIIGYDIYPSNGEYINIREIRKLTETEKTWIKLKELEF